MSNGIVVDHKETGVRYAISEHNFNDKIHERVRELLPSESVRTFKPKLKGDLVPDDTENQLELPETPDPTDVAKTTPHLDEPKSKKAEGSATAGTKGHK